MHKGIPKPYCVTVLTFFFYLLFHVADLTSFNNRVIYVNKEYKKVSGKGNA